MRSPGEPRSAAEVVRQLGGAARRADLLAWTTRHQLQAAVGRGWLERAERGLYVLPALPEAARAAAASRGVLSHLSAVRQLGLPAAIEPVAVHITVPPGARPRPIPGVVHHWSRLSATDFERGYTCALRAVLDCATALPLVESLAVADAALSAGMISAEALRTAAQASHGPGRRRRIRVAALADSRAANPFESVLRAVALDAGITTFVPQLEVTTASLRLHADLGDPELHVLLEADSFAHHGARAALARDCERYDEMVAAGWLVLRFAWEQVMFRQDWVAEVIIGTCQLRRESAVIRHNRPKGASQVL